MRFMFGEKVVMGVFAAIACLIVVMAVLAYRGMSQAVSAIDTGIAEARASAAFSFDYGGHVEEFETADGTTCVLAFANHLTTTSVAISCDWEGADR